jgi:hypothetical protein
MLPFLLPVISYLSHNTARTIGVLIVGSLLIGMPVLAYKSLTGHYYHKGYQAGYAKAVKDHPTTIQGDYYANGKEEFFILKIWKLRLAV